MSDTNCGPGMVYDSVEDKYIAKLEGQLIAAQKEIERLDTDRKSADLVISKISQGIKRFSDENSALKAEAEGYKNGQLQVQALFEDQFDVCQKYGKENSALKARCERYKSVLLDTSIHEPHGQMKNCSACKALRADEGEQK